jgi:hypothetical protein
MRTRILISALVLLLVANFLMMYVSPFGLVNMDGFQDASGNTSTQSVMNVPRISKNVNITGPPMNEKFTSYNLAEGGGAGDAYEPMGAFDNVRLSTGNTVSTWRHTAPNEPLRGPAFKPGPDSLFIFKNNQCKPECCGASFSCDGGCVCTTPQQRDYINQRGGNRTSPDDGV